ncbi:ankyrin repeat domain-containing protein [Marinomonas dokdonensis]|uniref:ankyrin repeat domain-containing protein n=1 Tax=Marinomonas dokdonensis TaxID=328224 RepID=UPI00405547DA
MLRNLLKINFILIAVVSIAGCQSTYKMTPLESAIHLADEEQVRLLAPVSDDVFYCSDTNPLFIAAEKNAAAVPIALSLGSNIGCQTLDKRTALHIAAFNNIDVGPFIEAGADVNQKDKYGYTPLHLVALNSLDNPVYAPDFPKLLTLEIPQNTNEIKEVRYIREENEKISISNIEKLIKAGANVNSQDLGGDTPLHKAVYKAVHSPNYGESWIWGYGKLRTLALIKNGADSTIEDNSGFNALDLFIEGTSYLFVTESSKKSAKPSSIKYHHPISLSKDLKKSYPNLGYYKDLYDGMSFALFKAIEKSPEKAGRVSFDMPLWRLYTALKFSIYGFYDIDQDVDTLLAFEKKKIFEFKEQENLKKLHLAAEKERERQRVERERQIKKKIFNDKVAVIKEEIGNNSTLKNAFEQAGYNMAYCNAFGAQASKINNQMCSFQNKYREHDEHEGCLRLVEQVKDVYRKNRHAICDVQASNQLVSLFGKENKKEVEAVIKQYSKNKNVNSHTILEDHPYLESTSIERMVDEHRISVNKEIELRNRQRVQSLIDYAGSRSTSGAESVNRIFNQHFNDIKTYADSVRQSRSMPKPLTNIRANSVDKATLSRLKETEKQTTLSPSSVSTKENKPVCSPIDENGVAIPTAGIPENMWCYQYSNNRQLHWTESDISKQGLFNYESGSLDRAKKQVQTSLKAKARNACKADGYSGIYDAQYKFGGLINWTALQCKEKNRLGSTFHYCLGEAEYRCGVRQK